MRPHPASRMGFSTALEHRYVLFRFASTTRSHSSSSMSMRCVGRRMPALLTRTCTPPKPSSAAATMRSTSAFDVTSPGAATASVPLERSSAAVCSAGPALMSFTTRAAPRAASTWATDLPIPWPAPVTMATLPSRSMRRFSSVILSRCRSWGNTNDEQWHGRNAAPLPHYVEQVSLIVRDSGRHALLQLFHWQYLHSHINDV